MTAWDEFKRWNIIRRWVHEFGWTHGAELGVSRGRTFKHLVTHCTSLHLVGVDLYQPQPSNPGPQQWTDWNHTDHWNSMKTFCDMYSDRTYLIRDLTTKAVHQVEDGSLDFVFIDADHGYQSVVRDIEDWKPKIRPRGRLIGHDIDWPTVKAAVTQCFGTAWNKANDNLWWVTC